MRIARHRWRQRGLSIVLLSALAGVLYHGVLQENGLPALVSIGLSTLFAVGAAGVLLTAGPRGFVMMVITLGLVAATALGSVVAGAIVDGNGWAHRLTAFWIAVVLVGLVGILRPFPTAATRHAIAIAATPDVAYRALTPSSSGAFGKDGSAASTAGAAPDAVAFHASARGPGGRQEQVQVTRDAARRRVSFAPLPTEAAAFSATKHVAVEPAPGGKGSRLRIAVELHRPMLGVLALHALLDLPSEEARRLKAHIEARSPAEPAPPETGGANRVRAKPV